MNELRASGFIRAFFWTAGLVGALSIVSIGGAFEPTLYFVWYVAVLTLLIAPFVVLGRFKGQSNVPAGVLAGVGVGLLLLTVTCFANLSAF